MGNYFIEATLCLYIHIYICNIYIYINKYISGQIIATSHDIHTTDFPQMDPNGGLAKGNPRLFQEYPGW